ncbi:hypothetical protein BDN70DRAFT_900751 [Pholiota conissans]|uniref:Uncharacterized protein n=1 Tax=Pholiota conissans TaxID=109636 RepID=A0A9P5YP67_9AGAR|nr:hypothetical protein BDN70DRAFT_900751 [Pholiota conissans]
MHAPLHRDKASPRLRTICGTLLAYFPCASPHLCLAVNWIWFRADGYPKLPIIDEDSVTPNVVRELLTDLISKTWGERFPMITIGFSKLIILRFRDARQATIPIGPHSLSREVLPTRSNYVRPGPLSEFVDINPQNMSRSDLFTFLKVARTSKEDIITFSPTEEILMGLHDNDDIIELPDPPHVSAASSPVPLNPSVRDLEPPPLNHLSPASSPLSASTTSGALLNILPLKTAPVTVSVSNPPTSSQLNAPSHDPESPPLNQLSTASSPSAPNAPLSVSSSNSIPVTESPTNLAPLNVSPPNIAPVSASLSHPPSPSPALPNVPPPDPASASVSTTPLLPPEVPKRGKGRSKSAKDQKVGDVLRKSTRSIPAKRKIEEVTGGSGQNSTGQHCAKRKNFAWIDTDGHIIEDEEYQRAKMGIPDAGDYSGWTVGLAYGIQIGYGLVAKARREEKIIRIGLEKNLERTEQINVATSSTRCQREVK